jgi:hypothetical protein
LVGETASGVRAVARSSVVVQPPQIMPATRVGAGSRCEGGGLLRTCRKIGNAR